MRNVRRPSGHGSPPTAGRARPDAECSEPRWGEQTFSNKLPEQAYVKDYEKNCNIRLNRFHRNTYVTNNTMYEM